MGYLSNPNNFLISVGNFGGSRTGTRWGINSNNGLPTPYTTDAYGNGMLAKNVDRHWVNNTSYSVFMPSNSTAETIATFRYAGPNTGMNSYDGYVWNTTNASYPSNSRYDTTNGGTAYFWCNQAAYPTDAYICWSGTGFSPAWGTPPACPTGFTDDGIQYGKVTPYLDYGSNGGGALESTTNGAYRNTSDSAAMATLHTNLSWQFYQYFTWGCGVPGYPWLGASIRYCRKPI